MAFCSSCGTETAAPTKDCPRCGAPMVRELLPEPPTMHMKANPKAVAAAKAEMGIPVPKAPAPKAPTAKEALKAHPLPPPKEPAQLETTTPDLNMPGHGQTEFYKEAAGVSPGARKRRLIINILILAAIAIALGLGFSLISSMTGENKNPADTVKTP